MAELFFREHTWDRNIWISVAINNEYRLSVAFAPTDCVLDIGSHIGSFAYKVLDLGAGLVVAVEPDPGNFELLRHNLHSACGATDRALLLPCAAVALVAGGAAQPSYVASVGINTGGSSTLGDNGTPVVSIPFDALVSLTRSWSSSRVRLLKLDCEGAEWPILERGNLAPVDAIVGEYHAIPDPADFPALRLSGPRDRHWLVEQLGRAGYEVVALPTSANLGLFWAWRPGKQFAAVGNATTS